MSSKGIRSLTKQKDVVMVKMGNEGAAEFWFDHGCWLVDQLHNKPFSHYAERQQLLYSGRKDCIVCASCVCVCNEYSMLQISVCTCTYESVHVPWNKEILYMFTVRYLNTPHEEVTWKVRRFVFEHLVYSLFDSRLFCRCWVLNSRLLLQLAEKMQRLRGTAIEVRRKPSVFLPGK